MTGRRPRLRAGASLAALAAGAFLVAPRAVAATPVVSSAPVTAAELGGTWHRGCPVGPSALRAVSLPYVGFDGKDHRGTIVVAVSVVGAVERVFTTLFAARFPIREMHPESVFGGSDPRSMAADNTSGFNCRLAVAAGPPAWSVHAYGEAIDVDPMENPYLFGGRADPPDGAPYLDRARVRPGMAVAGGMLVRAFAAVGWQWGGRWSGSPDYQHFSATGG